MAAAAEAELAPLEAEAVLRAAAWTRLTVPGGAWRRRRPHAARSHGAWWSSRGQRGNEASRRRGDLAPVEWGRFSCRSSRQFIAVAFSRLNEWTPICSIRSSDACMFEVDARNETRAAALAGSNPH